jgi:uncharacterized protein YprB with RNaseH-like and TPR domain
MLTDHEIRRLKKSELVRLTTTRCKHHHTLLEHPKCDPRPQETVAFLDFETSNLSADFGIIFSYALKPLGKPTILRVLRPDEIKRGIYDKELIRECGVDILKFDRIVTYYGSDRRFDLPFVRTRAVHWNVPFPTYKSVKSTDVYSWVKAKLKLSRNRLQNACDFFGIPAKHHPLLADTWFKAMNGNPKALAYIKAHNEEDVVSLEALYLKLLPFTNLGNNSI